MKNGFLKKSLFTILGWTLFFIVFLSSCENFLKGGEIKREIQETIAFNNAKEIEVLIQAKANEGTTVPSGNYVAKKGYEFEISFSETQGFSFIEWVAVDKNDESKIITEGVTFQDKTSAKTKVKITNDTSSIKILPKCTDRIAVTGEPSPRYESLGVSRDRPIIIEFTKELNPASFIFTAEEIPQNAEQKTDAAGNIWAYTLDKQTYLKNISITNVDGYSIAQHFKQPSISGKYLTVEVDKTKPIAFEVGVTLKTIVVTLDQAITDKDGVCMSAAKSWRYQITESTDDKATINFVSTPAQGTINAISRLYSIGQTIALSFTENADYQFIKWDFNDAIVSVADATNPDTTVLVLEKTTETNPTQIKAVCAERLRVTDFSPKTENAGSTVSKNTSITITFNKELPNTDADKEQLKNILISIGGTSVKSSFKNPVINANTITFAADNSNMIEVFAGQTKTVSVSIPADFYYINDGTKVTYGANGYSYDYKIDSSTSQKTDITFTASKQGAGLFTAASGTNEYSIGQEIPIAFEPTAGWKFTGWTITSAGNPVPQDKIRIEDSDSTSTKITILQEVKGVTITANAYFVPVIESIKINGNTDYWRQSSFPCDSVLYITFNKPIDTGTVDYSRYGTFTITRTENNNTHCEDYFETEWNDDNTRLILKPKPAENKSILAMKEDLVPEEDDTYNFLLTFNANGESITDAEGYILEAGSQTYNSLVIDYTVTGKQEKVPPEICDIAFYSTSDTTDYFYRRLTDLPINSWSRSQKTVDGKTFYNGDYSRNHVSHVYIELKGYDEGSGIKELRVKETYKKNIDGGNGTGTSSTTSYSKEQYASIVPQDANNDDDEEEDDVEQEVHTIYSFAVDYKFDSENTIEDGAFLLQISLVDNADNESVVKSCWVIKDSTGNYNCTINTGTTNSYPVTNNEAAIKFVQFTTGTDTFYKVSQVGLKSQRLFSLEYSESDKNNLDEFDGTTIKLFDNYNMGTESDLAELVNNALQNKKRDVRKNTKFTVRIKEESGIVVEFPIVILKSVDVIRCPSDIGLISHTYPGEAIEGINHRTTIKYAAVYTYQENENAAPGEFTETNFNSGTSESMMGIINQNSPNGIYTIYMLCNYYCPGKFDTYSSIGKSLRYYKGITNTHASNSLNWPDVILPKYSENQIYYVPNEGKAKFNIGLTYNENVNRNYSYYVSVGKNYSTVPIESAGSTDWFDFKVNSRVNYEIHLYAVDGNGNPVASYTYSEQLSLFDELNCHPAYYRFIYGRSSEVPNIYIEPNLMRCWYISPNGNYDGRYLTKAELYFVPETIPSLGREEITKYKKTVVEISPADIERDYYEYAYDDLEDGTYHIYVVCYNEAGNTSFDDELGCTIKHYVANYTPSLEVQSTGINVSSSSLTSSLCPAYKKGSISDFKNYISLRYIENGDWKDSNVIHTSMNKDPDSGKWNYGIPYTTLPDKFIKICATFNRGEDYLSYTPIFMKPVYAYTGYYEYLANWAADDASHPGVPAPDYCQSKAWMPMANGWQIFVDRPCFVHTMYCSKPLNGVSEWETRGQETGLVYNDGTATTFSYTDDRLDGVPEGAYYITICHFADGSTVASDVKQKE